MKKILLFIAALCCAGMMNATEGALSGAFTINAQGDKVHFSQGNLQYQASTNTWRFAEHQYDTIGAGNVNISASCSGWIDLFGWGAGNNPTLASTDDNDYQTFIDWGVNKISNGGNKANQWRTLTTGEWVYLCKTRTNAQNLCGQATVAGVHGFVFLPDNWTTPNSLTWQGMPNNWTTNQYSVNEWSTMQAKGAAFLPVAGYRHGTDVRSVRAYGGYWSSSAPRGEYYSYCAYYFYFISNDLYPQSHYYARHYGFSVRLVQDAK